MNPSTLIVVGGPTASGKTAAAIELALACGTEIVNVDSRQVYKELNIGVAKPTLEELAAVKHHGIGHVAIQYHCNAATHAEIFRPITQELLKQNGTAILCGGTGMYIEALLFGMDDLPEVDPDLRSEILDQFVLNGIEPLLKMLLQLDPNAGRLVQLSNPQRVMRALELCIQLRKPMNEIYRNEKPQHFSGVNIIHLGIEHNRDTLYQRINQRVDQMIVDGLIEECKALLPYREHKALNTVGYSEMFNHFDGNMDLDQTIDKIKQHSRNYAKRQITYFNNRFQTQWIKPEDWSDFMIKFAKTK